MAKRKMTPEKLERAIALRQKSWSVEAIAEELGISRGSVDWNLLKEGVDPPKPSRLHSVPTEPVMHQRGGHALRKFTVQEDARLLAMASAGRGYSDMAKALGRRPNSIRGRLLCLARREARQEAATA